MSAQLNLYAGTEARSLVVTKLSSWRKTDIFQYQCFIFSWNYDSPLLDDLNTVFWHFSSEYKHSCRTQTFRGKEKQKITFLLLCRPFFLNWRWGLLFVVPWFSWSQQQTSTNSKEDLTVQLSDLATTVFLFILSRIITLKAQRSTRFLCKVFIYHIEVIFHSPRTRGLKTTVTGPLPFPLHFVEHSGVTYRNPIYSQ